jgi:hypothetical protein
MRNCYCFVAAIVSKALEVPSGPCRISIKFGNFQSILEWQENNMIKGEHCFHAHYQLNDSVVNHTFHALHDSHVACFI